MFRIAWKTVTKCGTWAASFQWILGISIYSDIAAAQEQVDKFQSIFPDNEYKVVPA